MNKAPYEYINRDIITFDWDGDYWDVILLANWIELMYLAERIHWVEMKNE